MHLPSPRYYQRAGCKAHVRKGSENCAKDPKITGDRSIPFPTTYNARYIPSAALPHFSPHAAQPRVLLRRTGTMSRTPSTLCVGLFSWRLPAIRRRVRSILTVSGHCFLARSCRKRGHWLLNPNASTHLMSSACSAVADFPSSCLLRLFLIVSVPQSVRWDEGRVGSVVATHGRGC